MFPLIRMDWTLNRRILLQMSPIFFFQGWVAVSMGFRGLLVFSFGLAALGMLLPIFQNLRDTVEPFVCALPVSRAQIVAARYLSILEAMTLASLMSLALGWAGHRLGLGWDKGILIEDLVSGLGIQALILGTGAFLYLPFHFRFGGDLGVGIFMAALVVIIAALLMVFGWQASMARGMAFGERLLDGGAFGIEMALCWFLMGTASLGLSVLAYRKRTFGRPLPAYIPILFIGVVVGLLLLATRP